MIDWHRYGDMNGQTAVAVHLNYITKLVNILIGVTYFFIAFHEFGEWHRFNYAFAMISFHLLTTVQLFKLKVSAHKIWPGFRSHFG